MILRVLAIALCLFAGSGVARAHEHAKPGACEAAADKPAMVSAREALQRTPDALKARLGLADQLIDAGCYEEAVHVLEDGAALHARSEELQTRLRTARSLISERQFFDGLDKAELGAKLSRNVLRCTRFADLEACDQALVMKPDDVAVATARGDALLKTQRTIERCMSADGDAALAACQAILAKGAASEFELLRRIGVLQQAANQPSKALDTYIAANSLRRGDKSVALAIVALVDSTGRSDALALAARGSSLVTLGRLRDGIASMEQAKALTPGLPGIGDQLAAAQRLVRQEERMRESQPLAAVTPTRTYSNLQPASRSN